LDLELLNLEARPIWALNTCSHKSPNF